MTHVNMTTGIAVDTAALTRNGNRSGASAYARAMTMGRSAAQVTNAIFHFGGGCTGAGRSGSVNHVSSPDRTCDKPSRGADRFCIAHQRLVCALSPASCRARWRTQSGAGSREHHPEPRGRSRPRVQSHGSLLQRTVRPTNEICSSAPGFAKRSMTIFTGARSRIFCVAIVALLRLFRT